jgi:hypothetical protein
METKRKRGRPVGSKGRDTPALQLRKPGQSRIALPRHKHPGAAAPGSEAVSLPYGDRGAGAGPDRTQQPDTATGRDREGDAGAHTAGSPSCSVDGGSDRPAADRRALQLHHGMRRNEENATPNGWMSMTALLLVPVRGTRECIGAHKPTGWVTNQLPGSIWCRFQWLYASWNAEIFLALATLHDHRSITCHNPGAISRSGILC